MSKQPPSPGGPRPPSLSEKDRDDLVAYLDGELIGESARAMEARLTLDPVVRAEAESLKRTWDLLDYLPRPEASPSFTERTLSRLAPMKKPTSGARKPWWRLGVAGGWAAAVLVAALGGYLGFRLLVPRQPGDEELVHDLRLIENKRYYDLANDIEFVKSLDHPDLFGDDK